MTDSGQVPVDTALRRQPPGSAQSPVAVAAGAKPSTVDRDVTGYFDAYATLTRTLRGWLVLFGAGTPVVIASQADLSKRLTDSGSASTVVTLFLTGVALQVAQTLLYKACMWYCYRAADEPEAYEQTSRYKISHWISEQFWLELLFDLLTVGCFVAALFHLLRAVL